MTTKAAEYMDAHVRAAQAAGRVTETTAALAMVLLGAAYVAVRDAEPGEALSAIDAAARGLHEAVDRAHATVIDQLTDCPRGTS